MRRWTILLVLALAACDSSTPTSPPAPSSSPVTATDTQGRFRLTFQMPRDTWATSESLTGQAQLALTQGASAALSGSGSGPLGFAFAEVGGTRQMGPGWTADCAQHSLSADAPISSGFRKSGGWSDDQPDAAFYRGFFNDPLVHLPPGTWDISAIASFIDGAGCRGADIELQATIRVTITP